MQESTTDNLSLLQQELADWNNQLKELYLLKSLTDPLTYDPTASIPNQLEYQVFLKSRCLFTKYQINSETLEPLKDSLAIPTQLLSQNLQVKSPTSFGSLMMIDPLVLHSNDSNSQLYHQFPSSCVNEQLNSTSADSNSKFTPMDLYQFYLECKQLPTSQLLQSSQRIVTSKNWISSRNELKACRIIQRLEYLKESGACTMHVPVNLNQAEPKPKVHLDWMLDEMRWFAMEVWEERQWRKQIAKQLAHEAQQYLAIRLFGRKNGELEEEKSVSNDSNISFPLTVAKFLSSVRPTDEPSAVNDGILGPPKPFHSAATVSMQCWEGTFVPLVPLPSSTELNGGESLYSPLSFPSDSSFTLEDKVLFALAQIYSNNWTLVFEHLIRNIPTCTFNCPTDCFHRWKLLSSKKSSSLASSRGGESSGRKDLSPQTGALALTREYEFLTNKEIDEFIRVIDTIYTKFHDRPNRWSGNGSGLPKKLQSIPWNKSVAFQAHPSHDAALKKHVVSEQQVTVSELAFKRIKITSNNAPLVGTNINNQPIAFGHPHALSPTPQLQPNVSNNGQPVVEIPQRPVSAASPVFAVPVAAPVMIVDAKAPVQVANVPSFGMRVPTNPIFTAPPQGTTPVVHMQTAPFGQPIPYPAGIPIPHPKRSSAIPHPQTTSSGNNVATTMTRRSSKKSSTELVLDE